MRASFLTVSVLLHVAVLGIASAVVYGSGHARQPAQVQLQFSDEVPLPQPVQEPLPALATDPPVEIVLPEIDVAPMLPEPQAESWPRADAILAEASPAPTSNERVVPAPAVTVLETAPPIESTPPEPPSAHVDATPLHDRNQPPEYPALARQLGQHGTVRIRVQLDERGDVLDAEIAEPCAHAELNRAALRAVRKWKFAPATEGGLPVADSIVVPVVFVLTGA